MYLQGSLTLLQQWDKWRGPHELPARHDIKPLDVKTLLRDIFILDINDGGTASFRLAGTRLCSSFGRELRASPFASLWQRIDQPELFNKLGNVLHGQETVALDVVGVTGCGRELAYEIAFFPLQAEGQTQHILGLATPKALPFWFTSEPLIGFRNLSYRSHPMDLAELPTVTAPVAMHTLHLNARRVGHLTVYDGGKI